MLHLGEPLSIDDVRDVVDYGLAQRGPDYTYKAAAPGAPKGLCVYFPTEAQPDHCIFGLAFARDGITLDVLVSRARDTTTPYDPNSRAISAIIPELFPGTEYDVVHLASEVQGHQDCGAAYADIKAAFEDAAQQYERSHQ